MMEYDIRKANIGDADKISELLLLSAPFFGFIFSKNASSVLEFLSQKNFGLFSHKNIIVCVKDYNIAGMLLGYTYNTWKREDILTGLLMLYKMRLEFLKNLEIFLRMNYSVGRIEKCDYYISNLAVFPNFRGIGIGVALMKRGEEDAMRSQIKRMILDVECDNLNAINLYKSLGYGIDKTSEIYIPNYKTIKLIRMIKKIK